MNPVHIFPSYFPKIQSNIIIPSTPRSYVWSLSFRFGDKNLYAFLISPLSATWTSISSSLTYQSKNIWWSKQVMKLLTMQCSPICLPFLFGPNILLGTQFSKILNLCSSLSEFWTPTKQHLLWHYTEYPKWESLSHNTMCIKP